MTAKEMFEKMEYNIIMEDELFLIYLYEAPNRVSVSEIQFVKTEKKIQLRGNCPITIDRLKAINKQIEELGWEAVNNGKEDK